MDFECANNEQLENRLKEKELYRKHRKSKRKETEKELLRANGYKILERLKIYSYKPTISYMVNKPTRRRILQTILYDIEPVYCMTSKYNLMFFDENLQLMYVIEFTAMLNGEFFMPYEMICYWEHYKNKYEQYVGESYKTTLKRIHKFKFVKDEVVAYTDESRYLKYRSIFNDSNLLKKKIVVSGARQKNKQAIRSMMKMNDIEDFDGVFYNKEFYEFLY